jgi:hypothetical protein
VGTLTISPLKMSPPSSSRLCTPWLSAPAPPFRLPPAPPAFPRLLAWRFHELRMLLGTDLKVYRSVGAGPPRACQPDAGQSRP